MPSTPPRQTRSDLKPSRPRVQSRPHPSCTGRFTPRPPSSATGRRSASQPAENPPAATRTKGGRGRALSRTAPPPAANTTTSLQQQQLSDLSKLSRARPLSLSLSPPLLPLRAVHTALPLPRLARPPRLTRGVAPLFSRCVGGGFDQPGRLSQLLLSASSCRPGQGKGREMSCIGWFKRRSRNGGGGSSGPHPASAPATTTTAAVSGSTVSTSRSDDSGAVRPVSKSAGSTASAGSQRSISSLYEERGHGQLRAFEYEELQAATADFARAQKLGEGGFGSVYKGFIRAPPDGKADRVPVAVKRLNQRGLQGHKQWLAEVQFLGVLEHPNLVKLLGYCAVDTERGAQRLLVYEYMPNKSLEDHLFSRVNPPLSWNRRLQIILGAAEGLAYLHEGVEIQFPPDSRSFRMIMDPRLRGEYSVKAAREIAKLADSCMLKNAKERPTMSEVVEVLRRAVQAQAEPAGGDKRNGKGKKADAAAPSRR
ncbi:hypothetical protein EJB05_43684, partial [Eragrostis curvula]